MALSVVAAVLSVSGMSVASAAAPTSRAAAAVQVTKRVVVRPVHANGSPARGFTVSKESFPDFTCDQGASTVAVDANIRFCGSSLTYTVACWKSAKHTVLCLRDPASKKLVRIRYTGHFSHVAAPKRVTPQALRLGNRAYCMIRGGGAWPTPVRHPSWVGYYSCAKGAVYGPPNGDGINRSHKLWTVYTLAASGEGPASKRRVLTAYYVGTAR